MMIADKIIVGLGKHYKTHTTSTGIFVKPYNKLRVLQF